MEAADIVIKKSTMIKKNERDINSVYALEKGVIFSAYFQKLGSGSYGVVHKGVHNVTHQERAIKVIPRAKIKNFDRFRTEVRILQTLVSSFGSECVGPPKRHQAIRVLRGRNQRVSCDGVTTRRLTV